MASRSSIRSPSKSETSSRVSPVRSASAWAMPVARSRPVPVIVTPVSAPSCCARMVRSSGPPLLPVTTPLSYSWPVTVTSRAPVVSSPPASIDRAGVEIRASSSRMRSVSVRRRARSVSPARSASAWAMPVARSCPPPKPVTSNPSGRRCTAPAMASGPPSAPVKAPELASCASYSIRPASSARRPLADRRIWSLVRLKVSTSSPAWLRFTARSSTASPPITGSSCSIPSARSVVDPCAVTAKLPPSRSADRVNPRSARPVRSAPASGASRDRSAMPARPSAVTTDVPPPGVRVASTWAE